MLGRLLLGNIGRVQFIFEKACERILDVAGVTTFKKVCHIFQQTRQGADSGSEELLVFREAQQLGGGFFRA